MMNRTEIEFIVVLEQRNASLRRALAFAAFALLVALAGLASLADWRITAAAWALIVVAMPRFARR